MFRSTLAHRAGLVAAIMIGAAAPALAADLTRDAYADPPAAANEPALEWGSGWYLRGDLGFAKENRPAITPELMPSPAKTKDLRSISFGGGYAFNKFLRLDTTLEFRKTHTMSGTGANVVCPYALTGLVSNDASRTPLGYAYNVNDTCTPHNSSKVSRWGALANAYVDLGTYFGVTPYVGAGLGFFSTTTKAGVNYTRTSDGQPYAADLTPVGTYPLVWLNPLNGAAINPQPGVAFGPQNWDRKTSRSSLKMAWALMGGFSYDISPAVKLDVGYRYLNMGTFRSLASPVTGQTVAIKSVAHEVRAGMRFMLDN
ncbi:MAG: porin family protein [Rhizobiales bacterium]|nr:porin family protein [Hyphomicrobiales bacterium]